MMPPAWSAVTVREMLNHTRGLPDYTQSDGFRKQATTDPHGYVSPTEIIDWVRQTDWASRRGSRYEYSNTDNIVVGLIAQQVPPGESYGQLLSQACLPAGAAKADDVPDTEDLVADAVHPRLRRWSPAGSRRRHHFPSASGAWASGAIVSTPADLGAFVRADLGGRFFGRRNA